jgi:hypothetical protein
MNSVRKVDFPERYLSSRLVILFLNSGSDHRLVPIWQNLFKLKNGQNPGLSRARILKHCKVTAEKMALGKVNFSKGILKQPDLSLTAVCHCGQETYSLANGLNAAVLLTMVRKISFQPP